MKKRVFLTCVFIAILSGFSQDTASLENDLRISTLNPQKKFAVGFKTFLLYDLSRPPIKEQLQINPKEKGRVIQTNLWYPTSSANGKKLSFKDYLVLKGCEIDTTATNEKEESLAKTILSRNYNTTIDTISQLFRSSYGFTGMRNAPLPAEKFPLIVMLHNDPVGFAPLAEHLASNGFVVVNFPISGTSSKNFDWETIAGIETELSDMSFVVKTIANMPVVDSTCIIPIGYSYGAMAALAFQLRNRNVKGIISLDGGIGSAWGGDMLFKLPDFNIGRLKKPIFHAWSDLDNTYDHRWLNNYICCEKYLMRFSKLRHGDFVEGTLFEKILPGFTSKVLGKPAKGNEAEFKKLKESVAYFAQWIATGNKFFETQLDTINLSYAKHNKWNCTSN